MPSKVLLFSGGLDSTTLLWQLKPDVKAIMFDYGQRHVRELQSAIDICELAEVDYSVAELRNLRDLIRAGSQTGVAQVPEGHYAQDNMKTTIVPNRNMIMISIAVAHAISIRASEVWYAAHSGDHAIYPDCRPAFVDALREAIREGNAWTPVKLVAPFLAESKADVVRQGLSIDAPYHLTWSCYRGLGRACGRCGTCVERLEAFAENNTADPLDYDDRTSWRELVGK